MANAILSSTTLRSDVAHNPAFQLGSLTVPASFLPWLLVLCWLSITMYLTMVHRATTIRNRKRRCADGKRFGLRNRRIGTDYCMKCRASSPISHRSCLDFLSRPSAPRAWRGDGLYSALELLLLHITALDHSQGFFSSQYGALQGSSVVSSRVVSQ